MSPISKYSQWLIFSFALFLSFPFYGQDTISIYFEFGHSKLLEKEQERLNQLSTQFDFSDLDSVLFAGMADSVGNLKDNFRLSEKRAKNVARYCRRIFPKDINLRTVALGEKANNNPQLNRRVDIILYFPPIVIDEEQEEDPENVDCYYVDYRLMHRSNYRTIRKRKKKYVVIETELKSLTNKTSHYYGTRNAKGEFEKKRLRWKAKKTGNLWWAKKRYIATVPEPSFNKYRIFKTQAICDTCRCDTCNEDFVNNSKIKGTEYCLQVDRFLMDNIQFKTSFFNTSSVKVRAPREYVDLNKDYFIGCNSTWGLTWQKRKGWRRKNYYYATLPVKNNYICNVTRLMECCKNRPEPSACDIGIINCAFQNNNRRYVSSRLVAEVGNYAQNRSFISYAGIGLNVNRFSNRFDIVAGLDQRINFYGSLRYRRLYNRFLFRTINPSAQWQSHVEVQSFKWFGEQYYGTELKTFLGNPETNILEHNIHVGLAAVNVNREAFIPRIFVQFGMGYDYLTTFSNTLYPIAQIGVKMKIARFYGTMKDKP